MGILYNFFNTFIILKHSFGNFNRFLFCSIFKSKLSFVLLHGSSKRQTVDFNNVFFIFRIPKTLYLVYINFFKRSYQLNFTLFLFFIVIYKILFLFLSKLSPIVINFVLVSYRSPQVAFWEVT